MRESCGIDGGQRGDAGNAAAAAGRQRSIACSGTAAALQQQCSSTAAALQQHCNGIAAALQQHCSRTAAAFALAAFAPQPLTRALHTSAASAEENGTQVSMMGK